MMIPKIGIGELIVILGIVVLIFGAKRLPEIGNSLGKSIKSFQLALKGEEKKGEKEGES